MTIEEAREEQTRLSKYFDLSYWYGTSCKKCCTVFPKFRNDGHVCWYECPVCGARTEPRSIPWLAEEAWNRGDLSKTQMSLF